MTADLRERFLPGPRPQTGYRNILFLGVTGAGKTTLLRQLIGTDPATEPFPATSAFRTTTAVTEILCAPGPYYALATFSPRSMVRGDIEDCVIAAALAHSTARPAESVRDALLSHVDQHLRLEYILGADDPLSEDWLDTAVSIIDDRVRAWSIRLAGQDESTWSNELRADPGLEDLVNHLLELVLQRFASVTAGSLERDADGWPLLWRITSDARRDVLRALRRLTGNERGSFGSLLSPLVNGLRVRGPFHPSWAPEIPYLMLVDTVGLGHTPQTSISLSAEVVTQLPSADRVVVVDDGSHPMQSATASALRQVANAGYLNRLVLCFTHLDQVAGPNVRTDADRRALLRRATTQVIESLRADLDAHTHALLRQRIDEHTIFLRDLDRPMALDSEGRDELLELLGLLRRRSLPIDISDAHPVYRLGDLRAAVAGAVGEFESIWQARLGLDDRPDQPALHWRQVLALCQRLATGTAEYGELRPVSELHSLVTEAIRRFAGNPLRWDGLTPSDTQRVELLDRITRTIGSSVHGLIHDALVTEALDGWCEAASFTGPRSAARRAQHISTGVLAEVLSLSREDNNLTSAVVDVVAHAAIGHGARVGDTVSPPTAPHSNSEVPEPAWDVPIGHPTHHG